MGGPAQARLNPYQAYRLGPGQALENSHRPGQALLRPGLPGPLGTLYGTSEATVNRARKVSEVASIAMRDLLPIMHSPGQLGG